MDTSETQSYATSYQATSYQATSYQATSYQATSYQATSYQGAMYGSTSLYGAAIDRTTLSVKRTTSTGYEIRYPDRICTYVTGLNTVHCQSVDLSSSPSPLAGVTFSSTFYDPATKLFRSGKLRIGTGTGDVGAIVQDTTIAGYPLNGHSTTNTVVPYLANDCGNPDGCHSNSDLWLYEVYLIDTDGHAAPFCAGTNQAIALGGTWDKTGERTSTTSSSGGFTFACVNGTIAKCTRWGYRPFGVANNSAGTSVSLPEYHQACVRAATADYCANGHSFTKNHTLIDIYDFEWQSRYTTPGLIPRTQSIDPGATAFVKESTFDRHGATTVDHMRYDELIGDPGYGSISDPDPTIGCPNRFDPGIISTDGTKYLVSPTRTSTIPAVPPFITVANTGMCSHTEQTVGKYLNANCSQCTRKMFDTYGDLSCFEANGAWTADCVAKSSVCTSFMAAHSECTTDSSDALWGQMGQDDSACTIAVCSLPGFGGCCSGFGRWTSTCVAQANAVCTGGREHTNILTGTRYGFCNTSLGSTTTTTNSTNAP